MKKNKAIAFLLLVFLLLMGLFYKLISHETERKHYSPSELNNVTFRIQIKASKKHIESNSKDFKNLEVKEEHENNYYKYTTGEFLDKESANEYKFSLVKMGFKDAFVVTYLNGERIPT